MQARRDGPLPYKGPDASSAPASRPVVGVRVACPSLSSSGKSQFSRLGCEVGRNQSRLPSPHLPPPGPQTWEREVPPQLGGAKPALLFRPQALVRLRPLDVTEAGTDWPTELSLRTLPPGPQPPNYKLWSGKKSHRRPAPDDPPFPPTPRHPTAAGNTPFSAAPDRIFLQLPRPVRFPP